MRDIVNSWKGNFLVADLYEDDKCIGVCGTVCYKETANSCFGGKQLDDTFQLSSLTTDVGFVLVWSFTWNHIFVLRSRGLGVASKLMEEVERRASMANCNVYLETSSAQIPAIVLYKKRNYDMQPECTVKTRILKYCTYARGQKYNFCPKKGFNPQGGDRHSRCLIGVFCTFRA